ncbi:ShlB/FhaC/HecB family hemolysin secretion/activation protein [Aerosakkonema funiforme]|uniref:ShlB/FhaC/HecB family hemolysin secretion/activation protein n=2 Tax=Oscillatoriophycideae TaxID=1301283 RepID=A0A926ZIT4_9CYAN|nr:ShlB/FhaC/HecB family hemolysin secretion/activation protein [Aerosakkonema funiforme]MBD2184400.1 ShlB/FhaC/HecB family hemolysin secretion/activation protein [Aerosakkonema funiforme FACHB-1375]
MEKKIYSKYKGLLRSRLGRSLCSGFSIFSAVFCSLRPSNAAVGVVLLPNPSAAEFTEELAQNAPQIPPQIPPNPQPNPNTDRFLQPAPTPLPTTPEDQRPVLEITTPETESDAPPIRIALQKIEVVGNTVLSTEEINAITKPFEGREVSLDELRAVADAITKLYIDRGYITSRAVLPDQTVNNGVVLIRIIEGSLERIQIEGTRRLRRSYVRDRVRLGITTPLNTNQLEDRLRLLRVNPLFENVEASLRAGSELGKSVLVVRVTEAEQFDSNFSIDNYSAPSVGSERLGVNLRYRNITGFGDEVAAAYYRSTTGGSNALDFTYSVPLNAKDGTLQLRVAPNFYEITQPPFDRFNITGESNLYEISYRQPIFRSPRREFTLSLGFTRRESQTFLDGEPTPFGEGPDEEGRSRTSVINFQQEYVSRDTKGATAVRSQFSLGTGLLDATINPDPIPDGRFLSWLGQVQRVQRLSNNHLLILQADVQLTTDSLLSSQQFVIGGGQSLRGYRQNLRSGDSGFRVSIEDRITLQRNKNDLPTLQIAPFFDVGGVWNNPNNPNTSQEIDDERFLAGVGMGLLWEPLPRLNVRVDYGVPLISISDKGENAQDMGFYFRVVYQP